MYAHYTEFTKMYDNPTLLSRKKYKNIKNIKNFSKRY